MAVQRWIKAHACSQGVAVPLLSNLAATAEGRVVQRQVCHPHEQRAHRLEHRPRHAAQVVCVRSTRRGVSARLHAIGHENLLS